MPRKKVIKFKDLPPITEPVSEEKIAEAVEEITHSQQTEWRVLDRYFQYVRTYSIAQHGPDAKEKAYGYAKKIEGYCN